MRLILLSAGFLSLIACLIFFLNHTRYQKQSTYESALAESRQENKKLLLYFTGKELCPACQILDRRVLESVEFQAYAKKHFIFFPVDCRGLLGGQVNSTVRENSDFLTDRYNIQQIPTLLVVNPEGQVLSRLALFSPDIQPAEVIARLQNALSP